MNIKRYMHFFGQALQMRTHDIITQNEPIEMKELFYFSMSFSKKNYTFFSIYRHSLVAPPVKIFGSTKKSYLHNIHRFSRSTFMLRLFSRNGDFLEYAIFLFQLSILLFAYFRTFTFGVGEPIRNGLSPVIILAITTMLGALVIGKSNF